MVMVTAAVHVPSAGNGCFVSHMTLSKDVNHHHQQEQLQKRTEYKILWDGKKLTID